MERRKFMRDTISFSALIALHLSAQSCGMLSKRTNRLSTTTTTSRFTKVVLMTSIIEQQFDFYSNVLGFVIEDKNESQFSVVIGESIIVFKESKEDTDPFYHYAINIPSNKHLLARDWLAERTPLLLDVNSGADMQYFGFWDAHAVYFKDPAGNIGELIARHTLNNDRDGEFGMSDMLCVSEIGTPVANPRDMAAKLKTNYGLKSYGESMFVGDENGLFVLVPIERLWFPEYTQKAAVYPTEIYMSDKGPEHYQYPGYPYSIYHRG